mgnify:CR=1 FL=1
MWAHLAFELFPFLMHCKKKKKLVFCGILGWFFLYGNEERNSPNAKYARINSPENTTFQNIFLQFMPKSNPMVVNSVTRAFWLWHELLKCVSKGGVFGQIDVSTLGIRTVSFSHALQRKKKLVFCSKMQNLSNSCKTQEWQKFWHVLWCPKLKNFCCLPLWKWVLLSSSRAFYLSRLIAFKNYG